MRPNNTTAHAQWRKQQRGISDMQVELIRLFGDEIEQKGGCTFGFISERRVTQLRRAIDKIENVAIVVAPTENVVTVMHIDRRISRHVA